MLTNVQLATKLSYTPLVFQRINKKLQRDFNIDEAKAFVEDAVMTATKLVSRGKNVYAYNDQQHVYVTINANNLRVITVTRWTTQEIMDDTL